MISISNTKKGITLIESVVSIAILSVAITGPMALAAHSIKASGAARNELIATHLAEEGLEIVRNMRDNKSAEDGSDRKNENGNNWMVDIFSKCSAYLGCAVDATAHASVDVWNHEMTAGAIIPCQSDCSQQSVVYLNPGTGLYRQSMASLGAPWVRTQFRRTILLEGVDDLLAPKREVRVTSTVTFPGYGGTSRTISVSQSIFNWFPYLHF
ncbi:MAG: hypothetical protein A3C93_02740 [Candidatus Lloydbacteria bacterium RIFCSPHIGHO2_02_FULL_54_17]|uniref:Uncharacterized protein n=1 Tax=Candidatus Lloydbacteria bacterium RIFCSPHIGHO2_02_FULL_54_17 TaxID=1798664 RepID=A0A1G2DBE9_9BACT|nr:MAG: hypothetical protein A2762_05990 [Candidatus Lloydbacteria bacterium RIFCSPHIGHO2_01_FULL_54_11]OGZ10936.1 MAG: hypothetical protein A3C93_02740 [Candidatus Lloydbacteria bacterium RIFCSPHIGHO2_02_FULL_54_17]OGZ14917.1 MAG: hypothetical protein A2948_05335 [Candidatus Lloydbacteria bacterium RIFCSPLOWO2_01_FULL_54_18]OGZ17169.1 MAG: hypothetical protein A3H76_04125 [Candidatus Lloydbacteria bacterium RIFCSPLOWO2_02_FULL_54_12]